MAGFKQEARLENWRIVEDRLHGEVYGHPNQHRCRDGTRIRTSKIVKLNLDRNVAETMNTFYLLGNPKE